jgi:REP element-mobilizing transposase RayT
VVTWTILSNHFHVLLDVPPPPRDPLTDGEILDRCRSLYSKVGILAVESEFEDAQRIGGEVLERVRAKFLRRMWDLSEFMKTLKQKFTGWFNRLHERVGTLWESRFKSVIVDGSWNSLVRVAAYIDLNAVRAGLVEDPKDYRWCGYGEAVAGVMQARKGLALAFSDGGAVSNWRGVGPRYRKILFGIGEGNSERAGLSREEVEKVWRAGGRLSLAQLLRCRIRYFSDGFAVGSASFIEGVFLQNRGAFAKDRDRGARTMRGGDWGGMRVARNLRIQPIRVSSGGDG